MKLIFPFRLVTIAGSSSSCIKFAAVLCVLVLPGFLSAQSTDELRQRRTELLEEIQSNNRQLNDTRKNKKATIEQLALLQQQINNREELVHTLQTEIQHTTSSIDRTEQVVAALSLDIKQLQSEFTDLLRAAYRSKLQSSWLSFLLSAQSFNDVFRRWRYIRQYRKFRTRQAKLILDTQKSLQEKLAQLEIRKGEKASLLISAEQQQTALGRERNAQDQLLGRLKSSESKLLTEIQQQEKAREELSSAIEQAITIEMDRARRAERTGTNTRPAAKPTRPPSTSNNASTNNISTPPIAASGSDFASRKGQLPWPVEGGTIAKRFGKQEHPTVKGIQIVNNGIDIAVEGAAPVRVIADGTIISIRFVPGYRNMVLVKHGDFYTVYSNLENVTVESQTNIKSGQKIGSTSAQAGSFHFEIWQQKQRLNPASWIRRR